MKLTAFSTISLYLLLGLPALAQVEEKPLSDFEPPEAPSQFVLDPKQELPKEVRDELSTLLSAHHAATQQEVLLMIESPEDSQSRSNLSEIAKKRLTETLVSEDGTETNYFGRVVVVVFPKFQEVRIVPNYGLVEILDEDTVESLIKQSFKKQIDSKSIWGALQELVKALLIQLNAVEVENPTLSARVPHSEFRQYAEAQFWSHVGSVLFWMVLILGMVFFGYVIFNTRFADEHIRAEGKRRIGPRIKLKLIFKRGGKKHMESLSGRF